MPQTIDMARWIKIAISASALVFVVAATQDIGALFQRIAHLSPWAIFLALLLNTLNRTLMSYKWIRLLAHRGQSLKLIRATMIYCSSTIWGMFLPATIGADAVRTACTVREGIPLTDVMASVIVERLVGSIAVPLLATCALMLLIWIEQFDPRLTAILWTSVLVISVSIALLLLSFNARFYRFLHWRLMQKYQNFKLFQVLEKSHRAVGEYRSETVGLLVFFALTLLENSFPIVVTWIIGLGLGIPVPFLPLAIAVPIAYLAARIPLSIGGIGVYEGVFVLIMSTTGITLEHSVAMALVARVLQISAWLPWLIAYVIEGGRPNASTPAAQN